MNHGVISCKTSLGGNVSLLTLWHWESRLIHSIHVEDSHITIVYSSSSSPMFYFNIKPRLKSDSDSGARDHMTEHDPAVKLQRCHIWSFSLTLLFSRLLFPCSPSEGFSCIFYTCSNFCIEKSQRERESDREKKRKKMERERRVEGELVLPLASCC